MEKKLQWLLDPQFRRGLRILKWYGLTETAKIDKIEQLRSDLIWARYLWIFFACMFCYAVSLINY